MTPLFKKLNFKGQTTIVAINSPIAFDVELEEMSKIAVIEKELQKVTEIEFAICFVTTQHEIDTFIADAYPKLKGDAISWLCYPKMTSKNYTPEFDFYFTLRFQCSSNRQVAIDDDFSALRFRKVEFISTITRRESYALTAEAKKRTTQKGK